MRSEATVSFPIPCPFTDHSQFYQSLAKLGQMKIADSTEAFVVSLTPSSLIVLFVIETGSHELLNSLYSARWPQIPLIFLSQFPKSSQIAGVTKFCYQAQLRPKVLRWIQWEEGLVGNNPCHLQSATNDQSVQQTKLCWWSACMAPTGPWI